MVDGRQKVESQTAAAMHGQRGVHGCVPGYRRGPTDSAPNERIDRGLVVQPHTAHRHGQVQRETKPLQPCHATQHNTTHGPVERDSHAVSKPLSVSLQWSKCSQQQADSADFDGT